MQIKGLLTAACMHSQILKFFDLVSKIAPSATVVGGAIRDAVLSPNQLPNDLDIVVDNVEYDTALGSIIKFEEFQYGENRHGNARFYLQQVTKEPFHIDFWSPSRFYASYNSINEMLAAFDLSINALGVRIIDGAVYDPVDGYDDLAESRVRLIEAQWTDDDDDYVYHLVRRLNTLLERYPALTVVNPELALKQIERLQKMQEEAEKNDPFKLVNFEIVKPPEPVKPKLPTWNYGQKPTIAPYPVPSPPPPELKLGQPLSFKDIAGDWEETEVCETWAAGGRCPGCVGCPFEGPDGMYAD